MKTTKHFSETDEFFLQLHAKRYDQFNGLGRAMSQACITLNGGGIGILVSAQVFTNEAPLAYALVAILVFSLGLLAAFVALSCLYVFSSKVLGDLDTYLPLGEEYYGARLKRTRALLVSANTLLLASVALFFAATLLVAFALSQQILV